MKTHDFYYALPEKLIAQTPLADRSASRLMTLDRTTGEIGHRHFYEIAELLRPGDCLVLNNSRVLPARLCVCTTVAQREEVGIMAKEAIEPLLIFIQQTGLCVAGDALFRCISFESNENSSGKIYYHVMLPVEVGKTPK